MKRTVSSDRQSQVEVSPKVNQVSNDLLNSSQRGLLVANADQASSSAAQSSSTLYFIDEPPYTIRAPMKTIKEEEGLEDLDQLHVTTPPDDIIEDINRQIEETPIFKYTNKDPIQEHFEQVRASYDVQTNQVVPIDRSDYIQAMYNPQAAGENPELITVQVVNPRLREYSEGLAKELKNKSLDGLMNFCPKRQELMECSVTEEQDGVVKVGNRRNAAAVQPTGNKVPKLSSPPKCFYCSEDIKEGKVFSCLDCCDFKVCPKCNLNHQVCKQVKNKRYLNKLYQSMELKAIMSEQQERQFSNLATQEISEQEVQRKRHQMHKHLINDALKNNMGLASDSTLKEYAEVVPSESPVKDSSDKKDKDMLKQFCIVAIWKFNKNEQWQCHRMFKVEDPAFLKSKFAEEYNQHQFIHVGHNSELFYFTKELKMNGTANHVCHILDTDKAIKCQESELEQNTAPYFAPPVKEKIVIEMNNLCFELLDRFFNPESPLLARTPLQLFDFDQRKHLALTLPQGLAGNGDLIELERPNIYLFDLVRQQTVFTINGAKLLLDIKLSKESGKPESVTYLSSTTDIVKVEWDLLQNMDRSALKENPLKQKVFEYSPDPLSENYYLSQRDEQKKLFGENLEKSCFITGCIHKNGTRATICLQDQGLYSFELKDAQPCDKASIWCGQLGADEDFVIENMMIDPKSSKISGNGTNNKDEKLEVYGDLNYLNKWYCQIERHGEMQNLIFEKFTIDEMSGKVIGWGEGFVINNGGRSNNLVSFRLEFADSFWMFTGSMNEAKNEIEGKFQISTEDNSQKHQFRMSLSDKFYDCVIHIELKSEKDPRIKGNLKLTGTYNKESMTIKGNFKFEEGSDESLIVSYTDADAAFNNSFEIHGIQCREKAQLLHFSSSMHDAQLFKMKRGNEDVQMACGYLRIKENSTIVGYSKLNFQLLDLDYDQALGIKRFPIQRKHTTPKVSVSFALNVQSNEEQGKSRDQAIKELICLVPNQFKQYQFMDDKCYYKLPHYRLAPFRAKAEDRGKLTFQTQLLYFDPTKNRPNMIILNGEQIEDGQPGGQAQDSKMRPPQWPSHRNEDFIVMHPIIAYKSCAPTDDELIFVNLVQNSPQQKVNIAPFKFLQFVETGLRPTRNLIHSDKEHWETTVFMLVQLENKIYLMAYRCFPWPIDKSKAEFLPKKEGYIMLVTGCIDLDKLWKRRELSPAHFTLEKIEKASLLMKPNAQGDGCQIVIVLQLVDQVVGLHLQLPEFIDTSAIRGKMLQVPTQKGPSDQLYVAVEAGEGSNIIYQVTFIEKENLEYREVYRSVNTAIVAFQVTISETVDLDDETPNHSIYVLERDASYKCIRVTSAARDQYDFDTENYSQHSGSSEKVLDQLLNHPQNGIFIQCVLERDTISAVIQDPKTRQSEVIVINVRSNIKSKLSLIGFYHGRIKHNFAKGQHQTNERIQNSVFAAEKVPWIKRNIFEVQEANMSYFLIQQSLSCRKVNLMRLDTEQRLHHYGKQLIIGNHYLAISLEGTNQYLLYKQYDQSFCCTLPFHTIEPLTLTENGVQYFKVKDNAEGWTRVLKVDENGRFQSVYQSKSDDSQDLFEKVTRSWFEDTNTDQQVSSQWALYPKGERLLLGKFAFKSNPSKSEPDFQQPKKKKMPNGEWKHTEINLRVLILNQKTLKEGIQHDDAHKQKLLMMKNQKEPDYLNEFLSQRDRSVHQPTFFLIEYDRQVKLESEKVQNQFKQVLFTKEYMVVKMGKTVLFQKLSKIFKSNSQAYRDLPLDFKDMPEEEAIKQLLEKAVLIRFKKVDLSGIDTDLKEGGIKVHNVAPAKATACARTGWVVTDILGELVDEFSNYGNLLGLCKEKEKARNLIQISLNEVTILWELEGNKEVSFLRHQHPLACLENFVPTGFTLFKYLDSNKCMRDTVDFTQNEDCSFVLSPHTRSHPSHFFRTYSGTNLLEIKSLKSSIDDNQTYTKYITYSTFLANFVNLTFFQIFRRQLDFMELLMEQISKDNLKDQTEVDEQGVVSDNILIRKLYWTLRMNAIKSIQDEAQGKKGYLEIMRSKLLKKKSQNHRHSILHCLLSDKDNLQMIAALIKMIKLSSEHRLSDLVSTFKSFENALAIQSGEVNKFLSEAFLSSRSCAEIDTFEWRRGHKLLTFSSRNSLIGKEKIKKNFEVERNRKLPFFPRKIRKIPLKWCKNYGDSSFKTIPVEVKLLEISWIGDNLPEFYTYLRKYHGDDLFQNQIIKVLLESQYYSNQLVLRIAFPYIAYILICLTYFSFFLPYSVVPQYGFFGGPGEREQAALRIIVCLGAVLISGQELYQMWQQGPKYFKDVWNNAYWIANVLSIFICIEQSENVFGISRKALIQFSSLEVFFQWGFAFYWVRLFPSLAFYVKMIFETVKDCAYFIFILLAAIIMFGNVFYTLQGTSSDSSDGTEIQIWPEAFKNNFIDAAFSQYMIGLGEFVYDDWADHPSGWLIWIYFILATFFTQIMFLNMLIAIMGSTFGRVTENREKASLMERVQLYTDWYWAISFTKKLQGVPYLYVIRPRIDEELEKEASASEESMQSILKEICERDNRQQREVGILNEIVRRQMQLLLTASKDLKDLKDQKSKNNEKLDALEQKIDKLIANHNIAKQ